MIAIKVCKKCSGINIKELESYTRYLGCQIKTGCMNKCKHKNHQFSGKVYGLINHDLIVCDTAEEFLKKIKD